MNVNSPANVWEICEFSDEIKYGKLNRKMFAVELYEVLSGNASQVYQDTEKFLDYTYLSSDMKRLLAYSLKRLARNEGNAVYVLDTEFGGGKTHSLLLLYHIFRNRDLGNRYIRRYGLDKESGILEIPDAKVISIDCRKMDKYTLWGQLAHEAGKYDLLKENDIRKIPPTNIDAVKSLFDRPTLILIDELPTYLLTASAEKIGDSNLMELTLNFLTLLISAVSTSDYTALVITLTGRQSLYERYVEEVKRRVKEAEIRKTVEAVHDYFTSSVSRQAQYLIPVRDLEIYEVIRKRLVKNIKDREARKIVDKYYDYYLDRGLIEEPGYKKKMSMAYPFHPFLIDILHERVSTIEKFNRTRGALWLLATILHRIYKDRAECDLVTTGDLPVEDAVIKDALTSQLDKSGYINAVNTDVIEKAEYLDRRRHVKVVGRIARTIFLYSLIASPKISGIRPSEIKLAVCRLGEDPSIVDEALSEMERELWYLRREGGEYYFWVDPGINKVIYDYKKEVGDDEVEAKIMSTLRRLLKPASGFEIVWREEDLNDNEDKIRIYISLAPLDKTEIEQILDILPNSMPREYKNTLLFVYPDKDMLEEVRRDAVEVCAIEKAMKDARISQDKTKIKELNSRKNEAEGTLTVSCETAFNQVAYTKIGDGDIVLEEIHPVFEAKKAKSLTERIIKHLENRRKLIDSLNPVAILDIDKVKKNGYIRVAGVYEQFRKDRRLPYIRGGETVIEAVKKGVKESLFGYSSTLEEIDGKYRAEIGVSPRVNWDGYIIRKDLIYIETGEEGGVGIGPVVEPIRERPRGGEEIERYRPTVYRWSVRILSLKDLKDVLNAAMILKTTGDIDMTLSVTISAESDKVKIRSRMANVTRIKGIVEHLERQYREANVDGNMDIESSDDISEELKKYGLEAIRL